MPRKKDLKKLVRARMEKTGESYAAARAVLVSQDRAASSYAAPREEWPALAGSSDRAARKATGRTWAEWVDVLDAVEAFRWSHREIARHIVEASDDVSEWWAQTLTVGYERIRGLRGVGQRRGGSWDANKSRTYPVPVSTLYRTVRDARLRGRWLPEGVARVRTATVDRSVRMDWDDGTRVNFTFTAKGPQKSTLSLQHMGLADADAIQTWKGFWQERLDTLRDVLTG